MYPNNGNNLHVYSSSFSFFIISVFFIDALIILSHNITRNYEETKSTNTYNQFYSDDYQTMGKKILCGKFA